MANNDQTIIGKRKPSARSERHGVIQYHLLLRMAYKNLFFKKLRTLLTVVGVVIGVGAIVFLVSFGYGLQDLVSRQVIGSQSVQTIDVTSPQSKLLKMDSDMVNRIKGIAGVTSVNKMYTIAGRAKQQSSQTESVVYGAERGYEDLSSLKFLAGNLPDANGTNQVIINGSLAKALGYNDNAKILNQTVNISFDTTNSDGAKQTVDKGLTVKGVFDSQARAESFINYRIFEQNNINSASQLKVVLGNKDQVSQVRKAIESLGFTTASPLDTLDQINQVFTLLKFILVGFGGIGMVIAILGMFNTLTISLLERTREIGLMVSLGARKQDVRRLFITEALMLAILGGVFGVIGAIILGEIGNLVLNGLAHHNGVTENIKAFIISPWLVMLTLVSSAVLGLVVVYFPARRAAQINPIEALRSE